MAYVTKLKTPVITAPIVLNTTESKKYELVTVVIIRTANMGDFDFNKGLEQFTQYLFLKPKAILYRSLKL